MPVIKKRHYLSPSRIVRGLYYRINILTQGVLSIPIKCWYGNNAGWRNNWGEKQRLKQLRRHFSHSLMLPSSSKDLAKSLQEEGYCLLPPHEDKALLQRVEQKTMQAIEDPASSIASPNKATRFLLEPITHVPEMKHLLSEEIANVLLAYYQCAFRIESIRVWRNYHVPNAHPEKDDKFSNTFHHDNCPVNGLRVFILLTDKVSRETGAFRFHNKKVSQRIIRGFGYFHREKLSKKMRKRLISPETLSFFEGNVGDVCICNTQACLHAASIPKEGSYRDILQFEVYPVEGPFSDKQLFAHLPPDKALLTMQGRQ